MTPEAIDTLTFEEIDYLIDNIDKLPEGERVSMLLALKHFLEKKRKDEATNSLIGFARYIWPEFRLGPHHKYIANLYDRASSGEGVFATVSVAPRHGKSQLLSWLGPCYFLGKRPTEPIILATHTTDLSTDFGRKIKNTINSPQYKEIFPETEIASDSRASGKFNTSKGGGVLCVGTGSSIAGYGGRIIVCGINTNKVRTLRGVVSLGTLRPNDHVAGPEGWEKVTTIVENRQTLVYSVDSLVDVSADHPFAVVGRGWVPAEELRAGDRIRTESIWNKLSINLQSVVRTLVKHLRTPVLTKQQRKPVCLTQL